MRRHELIGTATARLAAAGVASPEYDANALLAFVLDLDRGQLALVDEVAGDRVSAFEELLTRRSAREPLQHLTGRAGFRYVELEVGPGVFVPRPETEQLVGWTVRACGGIPSPIVVDLGTGSGAIAKSVAHEVSGAQVHAVELDPAAHRWAGRNLAGTGVRLHLADLADCLTELQGSVDVVVSNPPYIPLEAWESVDAEARDHDPDLALWSGVDGLDAIRQVEATAARLLRPGGVVGVEHADVQGRSAPAVFATSGRWSDVRDNEDLSGRPRFLTARLAR